jgi:hypothetical protein
VLAVDAHPAGRIASAGRDRRVRVWEADGRPVADLGPTADEATRVAWSADARTLVSGDWSGALLLWNLAESSSTPLPVPVAGRPSAITLVEPVLTPARPWVPQAAAAGPVAAGTQVPDRVGDDLDAALASAREAAAAADRAVSRLARLAWTRGRSLQGPRAAGAPMASAGDAIEAANAALTSLRAALAADPANTSLARAIEETERAIRLMETRRNRLDAPRVPSAGDR